MLFGLGRLGSLGSPSGGTGARAQILLSGSTLLAGSAAGTLIGALSASRTTGTPVWSLTFTNGNRFRVTGANLEAGATASAVGDNPSTCTVHVTGTTPVLADRTFTILIVGTPAVTGVALTSNAGADQTYIAGDVVQATVTYSEAVNVTGSPTLALTVGASSRSAVYASGSGTTALVFAYTIIAGDNDANGISIAANSLALGGGTIQSVAAGINASLTHSSVADQAAHKVDTTSPTVSTVALTSSAGADQTYIAGDVVQATVTFSAAVNVTGAPQLALTIGSSTVQAVYTSGSGGTALVFSYTVQPGDTDANGISIAANSLTLAGGTILSVPGNAATLTHAGVADQAAHKVDTTAPTISVLNPPNGATSVANSANLVATFSEAVAFGATVSIGLYLTVGGTLVQSFTAADIGGALTIAGTDLTINPTSDLASLTGYYVLISAGSIKDLAGNAFAGIASSAVWSFASASTGGGFVPSLDFSDGRNSQYIPVIGA